MLHKAQQEEYRRLKAERKNRLYNEEQASLEKKRFLKRQKTALFSERDLILSLMSGWPYPPEKILSISPVEGGWILTYLESKYVA